jgi:hypothetical protein
LPERRKRFVYRIVYYVNLDPFRFTERELRRPPKWDFKNPSEASIWASFGNSFSYDTPEC